jgi:hypothetical protein
MLLEEPLFEIPNSVNATEFGFDDTKFNHRATALFKFDGEVLEDDGGLLLIKLNNRIALIDTTAERPRVLYYVQWGEIFHKLVGHRAITQVAVWADPVDPRSTGIAARIFLGVPLAYSRGTDNRCAADLRWAAHLAQPGVVVA